MKNILHFIHGYFKVTLCYQITKSTDLCEIITLTAIRHHLEEKTVAVHLQPVVGSGHVQAISTDEKMAILFLQNKEGQLTLSATIHREEAETISAPVSAEEILPKTDAATIKRFQQVAKKVKELKFKMLWPVYEQNHTPLTAAMLVEKYIQKYRKETHFLNHLIESGLPSVYSLFFSTLDYLHRHGYSLRKPKQKALTKQGVELKGNTVLIQKTGEPNVMDTIDGFALYPKAKFMINYWFDGRLQILLNKEYEHMEHVSLEAIYGVVMDFFRERLEKSIIPLSTIKWVSEVTGIAVFDNVLALHDTLFFGKRSELQFIKDNPQDFHKSWDDLTKEQTERLDKVGLNLWELFHLTDVKDKDTVLMYAIPFYGRENRPGKIEELFSTRKCDKLSQQIRKQFLKMLKDY